MQMIRQTVLLTVKRTNDSYNNRISYDTAEPPGGDSAVLYKKG